MTEKMTKKDYYNEIIALATDAGRTDLADFCSTQIELLDKKAAKAKETATAKKANDPYLDVVKGVLTDEFQTLDVITAAIGDAEFTKNKASTRLKKLVEAGIAEKGSIAVEKRKLVAYKLVD